VLCCLCMEIDICGNARHWGERLYLIVMCHVFLNICFIWYKFDAQFVFSSRVKNDHILSVPLNSSLLFEFWGEAMGVFMWLWIFHRARHDLPVFLGFRHHFEHAPDPFALPHDDDHHHHGGGGHGHKSGGHKGGFEAIDKFNAKAMAQRETDDDDDEEEGEEEQEDEDE
jgi:hypothetical protein